MVELELVETFKGRGAPDNPASRFDSQHYERGEYDQDGEPLPDPRTVFLTDHARTIVTRNDSPDVGFELSVNPYRGCEHGCIYCYARPTHEYLGFSPGLDFETKILVKERAPELLRRELASRSWRPQPIGFSGVTDPYQPVERRLGLTRRCLEVLAEFRNPVFIITKNHLVTRDRDHLTALASHRAAAVFLSLTTLDETLWRRLEPRTSRPSRRLEAIRELAAAGVPVGVNVAPVIPGLTDHETGPILEAAHSAGARFAGYTVLRLPLGVKDLFSRWLEAHYPDRKEKVLNRVRDLRGGKLNESEFGSRMRGEGPFATLFRAQFRVWCRRVGFLPGGPELSTAAFLRPPQPGEQTCLF